MNTKNQFGKKGWTPDRIKDLSGKTFVITGTTSGTGLAQIMSIYELQDRPDKAGKTDVKAYACHPGFSRTNLGIFKLKTDKWF